MKTSEQINELATALAKAQGEFTNPERDRYVKVKTKAGGEYGFWYSTLAAVKTMARPVLAKHGLSCTQPPTVRDGAVVVLTRLMHSSGQFQEEEIAVTPESLAPQQIGSGITYMRRYAYCGMLDIVSDEDDDGAAAGGHEVQESHGKAPKPACPECHKSESVIENSYAPGFYCFPKRGGCGHKWEPVAEQSNGNGQKSEAKKLAEQHGMKTGDEIGPSDSYQKAKAFLATPKPLVDAKVGLVTFAAKWKEQRIAKHCTSSEYAEIDALVAKAAIEACKTREDFAACEKLIRGMHGELRVSEGDYMQLATAIDEAKDAKLGVGT